MTVLAAVGVVPKNGLKSYVIMGADTKKITRIEGHEDIIDEEYRKIFKKNGKLIGISGRVNEGYITELVKIFSEFEESRTISELVQLIEMFSKEFISEYPKEIEKVLVLVATVEENQPIIVEINILRDGRIDSVIHSDTEKYKIKTNFPGYNIPAFEELESKINENDKFDQVKKYVNESLTEVAKLVPDTSNQNILIESIVK